MTILFLLSAIGFEATSVTEWGQVPAYCYVANTAVIWYGDPEYKIHRIITTGIRRYANAGNGSIAKCAPKDAADLAANRAALARVVDSMHVAAPFVMTRMELTVQSVELIRSQLVALDAKARAHPDDFAYTEIVDVTRRDGSEATEVPLPALSTTPRDAESCKARNDSLHRAVSAVRPAC